MLFDLSPAALSDHTTDLLVMVLCANETAPFAADTVQRVIENGDFAGKAGDTLLIPTPSQMAAKRLLLVGLGDADKVNAKTLDKAAKAIASAAVKKGVQRATLAGQAALDETFMRQLGLHLGLSSYQYRETFGTKELPEPTSLAKVDVPVHLEQAKIGHQIAQGANLTRELGNLPANICTPTYLAGHAHKLEHPKLQVEILGEDATRLLLQLGGVHPRVFPPQRGLDRAFTPHHLLARQRTALVETRPRLGAARDPSPRFPVQLVRELQTQVLDEGRVPLGRMLRL